MIFKIYQLKILKFSIVFDLTVEHFESVRKNEYKVVVFFLEELIV